MGKIAGWEDSVYSHCKVGNIHGWDSREVKVIREKVKGLGRLKTKTIYLDFEIHCSCLHPKLYNCVLLGNLLVPLEKQFTVLLGCSIECESVAFCKNQGTNTLLHNEDPKKVGWVVIHRSLVYGSQCLTKALSVSDVSQAFKTQHVGTEPWNFWHLPVIQAHPLIQSCLMWVSPIASWLALSAMLATQQPE